MNEKPNVLVISGNTYQHHNQLSELGAIFDQATKCWLSSISRRADFEEFCQVKNLQISETYDESYRELKTDKERDLAKTESRILASRLKLIELNKKISEGCSSLGMSIEEILKSEKEDLKISEIIAIYNTKKEMENKLSELERRRDELKKAVEEEGDNRLVFKTLAEQEENWFTSDPGPQPMLLRYVRRSQEGFVEEDVGFLPQGIVAMFCGAGGTGKTRALSQLAFSIASGMPFFDNFEIANGKCCGRVFLGLGEEPKKNIQRRLYKIGNHYRGTPYGSEVDFVQTSKRMVVQSFYGKDMRLIEENGTPSIKYHQFLEGLKASEGAEGFSLIVLDPISRFLSGETERDNNAATKLIALLEKLTTELKGSPTIIFGHHMNKGSSRDEQTAARGSSGLTDGVRMQINMWTPTVTVSKNEKKKIRGFRLINIVKANDVICMPKDLILKFDNNGFLLPAIPYDYEPHELKQSDYFNGYKNKQRQTPEQKSCMFPGIDT